MKFFLQQSLDSLALEIGTIWILKVSLDFSTKLDEEFTCLANSALADVWYIDSGALAHMIGV